MYYGIRMVMRSYVLGGFWVHGCVDGHSHLIINLEFCSNKTLETVLELFKNAVRTFGWPSRACGNFGKENNGIEVFMVDHWGAAHRAYICGRWVLQIRLFNFFSQLNITSVEVFSQCPYWVTVAWHLQRFTWSIPEDIPVPWNWGGSTWHEHSHSSTGPLCCLPTLNSGLITPLSWCIELSSSPHSWEQDAYSTIWA